MLTAGYTLPLAFRRQAPLTTAALSTACVLLFGAVDPDNSQPTLPLALALAAYTVGAEVELPRSAVAAAAGLSVFLAALFADDAPAADAIFVCALYGAPYLSGALLRRRTAGYEERERRAVEAERARLARELHDVVVALDQRRRAAVPGRPPPARAAPDGRGRRPARRRPHGAPGDGRDATAVRGAAQGRRADAARAPAGARPAAELIEGTRAAGLPVELRIEGEPRRPARDRPRRLPDRAGGADQRGPARRPARATCASATQPDRVELRVDDDARGGSGHRTAPAGTGWSACASGSRSRRPARGPATAERGGFRVRATLPLREGAA